MGVWKPRPSTPHGGVSRRGEPNSPPINDRRLKTVRVDEILDTVAWYHDVEAESYPKFRSESPGRDMAAWLCRKWTRENPSRAGPSLWVVGGRQRIKLGATSRRKVY